MSTVFPRLGSEPASSGLIGRIVDSLVSNWHAAWALQRRRLESPVGWAQLIAVLVVLVSYVLRVNSGDLAISRYERGLIEEDKILSTAYHYRLYAEIGFGLAVLCCWRAVAWGVLALTAAGDVAWWSLRTWPPVALLLATLRVAVAPVVWLAATTIAAASALKRRIMSVIETLWHGLGACVGWLAAAVAACGHAVATLLRLCVAWLAAAIGSCGHAIATMLTLLRRPLDVATTTAARLIAAAVEVAVVVAVLACYAVWRMGIVPTWRTGVHIVTAAALLLWRPVNARAAAGIRIVVTTSRIVWHSASTITQLVARFANEAWRRFDQLLLRLGGLVILTAAYAVGVLKEVWEVASVIVVTTATVAWVAVTLPIRLACAGLIAALDLLLVRPARVAWAALVTTALLLWRPVRSAIVDTYEAIAAVLRSARSTIARWITLVAHLLALATQRFASLVAAAWRPVGRTIAAVLNAIATVCLTCLRFFGSLIDHIDRAIVGAIEGAVRQVARAVRLVLQALERVVDALWSPIAARLAAISTLLRRWLVAAETAMTTYWRRLQPPLQRILMRLERAIESAISHIDDAPLLSLRLLGRALLFIIVLPWRAAGAAAKGLNRASYLIHEEVPLMPQLNFNRSQFLWALGGLWALGALLIFFTPLGGAVLPGSNEVVVVHWSNGHLMRETLLPQMAEQFNAENHKTASGKHIVVKPYFKGSVEQMDELYSRTTRGVRLDPKLPDATIVSPSADHWIVRLNYQAGHDIIDLGQTESIAKTWIGIVTYREMAECLGWPNKAIGYSDIVALRQDPKGWASYSCAKASWGQRPLLAYTDPLTSSTGRSALFSLYAIAAGKPADQLTVADISNPANEAFVRQFQDAVDHYLPGTLPLNTQIHQGPAYGHFFIMPEDNLIHLYEGTESAVINGKEVKAPPLPYSMVMIYPKEGSAVHNHSASLVQAPWVTEDDLDGARQWTAYLRQTPQQEAFVRAGFRPATDIPFASTINSRYGLDPTKPTITLNPDRIDKATSEAIITAWSEVKKPGIVTFVFDTSGSMQGKKLTEAKEGLVRSIDGMSQNNSVGLITFDDAVRARVEVGPLSTNRFVLAGAIEAARAVGNTALYDAVKAGIEMADNAPGDPNAIRGVVVLSDGLSNRGNTKLTDIVKLTTRQETVALTTDGVDTRNLIGASLAMRTNHRILVFFIGIGEDADMEVARLLTEATGAGFIGATQEDLASVIEEFGKYF